MRSWAGVSACRVVRSRRHDAVAARSLISRNVGNKPRRKVSGQVNLRTSKAQALDETLRSQDLEPVPDVGPKATGTNPTRKLSQFELLLNAIDAPVDADTLISAFRLVTQIPHFQPRAKLAFGVRMLQRARAHNVPLDAHGMRGLVVLAEQCRKVNLTLVVSGMMERQGLRVEDPLQQQMGQWTIAANDAIPSDFEFYKLLNILIRDKQAVAAAELWENYRRRALDGTSRAVINAKFLANGAWISTLRNDIIEATWISKTYTELGITPDARSLRLLAATHIHAGQFDAARELMRWMLRLGFVLHEREIYYYISASMKLNPRRRFDGVLAPLGELFLDAEHLCSSRREQTRVLRGYLRALYVSVANGCRARLVAPLAERVMKRWALQDSVSSSFVTYLACRAERLDMALSIARVNHDEGIRTNATSAKQHGSLRWFAYEALIEQSVREHRVPEALALIFTESDEPSSVHIASFAGACYISSLGRLGELGLCGKVYKSYVRRYGVHVTVSTAAMGVLSAARRQNQAVAVFSSLMRAHRSSVEAAAPNEVTYAILSSIVLRVLVVGHDATMPVSKKVLTKLVQLIENYMRKHGEDIEAKAADDPDQASLNATERPVVTKSTSLPSGPDEHVRMKRQQTLQEIQRKLEIIRHQM
ncbi:hypothetical protein FVE85_8785 [Porphyridium purpureum]|uniref:Uncharacterized protein n=1 Tax=Porphyridium purpureum TaxID=35688 RepID=A0A5J4YQT0_PORPP|nr:hypothetical protein FVE85_8785 [Porphyridium purpureum]|eukprot:POR7848..scf296_7